MADKIKNLLITGKPKTGKSSLIKKLIETFPGKFCGFYTEELVDNTGRYGFKLVNTQNESSIFAIKFGINTTKEILNKNIFRYKKYKVYLDILEKFGVEYITRSINEPKIFLIDEIGSMECLSTKFCELVITLLSSDKPVIATVRYNAHSFTDRIKKFSNSKLLFLERANFNQIYEEIKLWVEKNIST